VHRGIAGDVPIYLKFDLKVTHPPFERHNFTTKFNVLSIKVCYKVSLCENFQRQSCSYIIPLSNGA